MKTIRRTGLGLAVGVPGLAFWFMGALDGRADANADKIADVQAKISALEKFVLADEPEIAATNSPAATAPAPMTLSTNAAPANVVISIRPPGGVNAVTTGSGVSRAVMYFYGLRQDTLREDYANAIAAAHNLEGADPRDEIKQAIAGIVPELEQLRDARASEVDSQIQGLADQVTKAILAAKDPKDLDAIVQGIDQSAAKSRTELSGAERQTAYQQIENVSRYAKGWQRYLADVAAGNAQQSQNDLRMLTEINSAYMPIPRSQLLALELGNSDSQPLDVKIELKSLDDIPAAIAKLQDVPPAAPQGIQPNMQFGMQPAGEPSPAAQILINSLESLQNSAKACGDKDYTGALKALAFPFFCPMAVVASAGSDKSGDGSVRKQVMNLEQGLLIKIAQGLLAMPDLPAAKPEETAADYMARAAAQKAKAADWTGLQQVLIVTGQIAGPGNAPPGWQEDMNGLHAYLVGEKLEAAGQNLDAIRSYRESLATLGKFFPADPPAAKLKALQAKYPDLYQQALVQPITKTE